MNKGLIGLLAFIAGSVVGFFAADKLMKDKYEQIVQDEIDSVKAAFRKEHPLPEREKKEPKPTEEERRKYSRYVSDLGYSEKKTPEPVQRPYIIAPEAFGDQDGYDEISLTYYADKVVTDDNDRAMSEDEIEETIGGRETLTHFGEYEDDSVFVRNDRLKADYEILMDQRTYASVLTEKPYLVQ